MNLIDRKEFEKIIKELIENMLLMNQAASVIINLRILAKSFNYEINITGPSGYTLNFLPNGQVFMNNEIKPIFRRNATIETIENEIDGNGKLTDLIRQIKKDKKENIQINIKEI